MAFNTLTGSDISESRLSTVPERGQAGRRRGQRVCVKADATRLREPRAGHRLDRATGRAAPAVDVDPLGYVHLRGSLTGLPANPVSTLPAGARPADDSYFVASNRAAEPSP